MLRLPPPRAGPDNIGGVGSGLFSPGHLAILLVVVLLVFGPKRLPELGRSLGEGMRSFKGAVSGDDDSEQSLAEAEEAAPGSAAGGAPRADDLK